MGLFDTISSISDLITEAVVSPPLVHEYPWLNETTWKAMMDRVGDQIMAQQQSPDYYIKRWENS